MMATKSMKKAKIIIVTILICLLIINIFLGSVINNDKSTKVSKDTAIKLPYVVVHIDLKGSPPKLEYMESLLQGLKEHGVNGLLVEYEDMFPFDQNLAITAKNSYSCIGLKNFLTKAAHLGFEIIPLIQTFGHMEYILKLQQYKHLREDPSYFDSICPSHPESIVLIKKMLEQVIYFHNNISTLKFIHIGCDEVYHINKCTLCRQKRLVDLDIFVNHLQSVIGFVKEISPDTKVLMWDDMFRGINSDLPKTILHDTEPVYWDYKPKITISHIDLMKYRRKFQNIWIASAFKGADDRRSATRSWPGY
ncbi:hypothetical protein K1T71_013606 [Dendrolimus kikuchii]|uniref:Uncharacterized protein n=1 Tax=Dendrolimus kikuchii TaxID=765133 RepID=A0ACC1CGZ1_9NEOP|nr:hypothetical protein K1T71_013606 [Dendrolimus kikuchii]